MCQSEIIHVPSRREQNAFEPRVGARGAPRAAVKSISSRGAQPLATTLRPLTLPPPEFRPKQSTRNVKFGGKKRAVPPKGPISEPRRRPLGFCAVKNQYQQHNAAHFPKTAGFPPLLGVPTPHFAPGASTRGQCNPPNAIFRPIPVKNLEWQGLALVTAAPCFRAPRRPPGAGRGCGAARSGLTYAAMLLLRGQRSMVAWYFMFSICFLRASLSIPLSTVGSSVRPGRALAAYIRGRRARCCGTPTNWNKSGSIRIHARGVREMDAPFRFLLFVWSVSFTFCSARTRCRRRRATLHNANSFCSGVGGDLCSDDKWIQQTLYCLLSAT